MLLIVPRATAYSLRDDMHQITAKMVIAKTPMPRRITCMLTIEAYSIFLLMYASKNFFLGLSKLIGIETYAVISKSHNTNLNKNFGLVSPRKNIMYVAIAGSIHL
jgi:hypothetical protein